MFLIARTGHILYHINNARDISVLVMDRAQHIRATCTRTKLVSYMTVWLSVSEFYQAVVQL